MVSGVGGRSWEWFDLGALLRRVQLSLGALGIGERPVPLQVVGGADEEGDVGDVVGVTGRHPHTVIGGTDKNAAPFGHWGVTGRIQVGVYVGGRPGWRVCSGDGETQPDRPGRNLGGGSDGAMAVETPTLGLLHKHIPQNSPGILNVDAGRRRDLREWV